MAYFARDEVALQEDSCDAELALHARLSAEPFAAVSEEELDAIKDRDVVHNYRAVLAFRDFLAQHVTCLLYTSPSPRDLSTSRMPSSA